MSIRGRLTLGYTFAMALLLFGFVGADVIALQDDTEAWHHALVEHGLLALVVTVGIAVVSYVIVGRAFRPVREIVRLARSITAEDLSQRVSGGREGDEIGELVATLNDMIARLETSFSQISQFSADAAHEMKTPLATMRGEIEIALRKPRSVEAYEETLRKLGEDVAGLSRLVDNLLFLARSSEPTLLASFAPVALEEIALRAFERVGGVARERGVRLDLGTMDEVEVVGDAALLERLVSNLLCNAIEHTASGRHVRLAVSRGGEAVQLSVEDEGEGIPPEFHERVFDRMVRVDPSRSKRTGGAGLGLAIVRAVADAHGATIELSSEQGRGTRVVVGWAAPRVFDEKRKDATP